jgi:hypothetical protein
MVRMKTIGGQRYKLLGSYTTKKHAQQEVSYHKNILHHKAKVKKNLGGWSTWVR